MENKNEIIQNKPLLETHISTSKDGKYLIHKTILNQEVIMGKLWKALKNRSLSLLRKTK